MKTSRSTKIIKKLEQKQKRISELTEELNKLHLSSDKLIKKLREEHETDDLAEEATRPAVLPFFTGRGARNRGTRGGTKTTGLKSILIEKESIKNGDTVEITNSYRSKKYGNLKVRQGTVQRQ